MIGSILNDIDIKELGKKIQDDNSNYHPVFFTILLTVQLSVTLGSYIRMP